MKFRLIPTSKEYYDNQILIHKRRKGIKEPKFDELEIKYFEKMGIDIRPDIRRKRK